MRATFRTNGRAAQARQICRLSLVNAVGAEEANYQTAVFLRFPGHAHLVSDLRGT